MISYCHKLDVCLCVSLLLVYPDETARPGPSEWRTFGMADRYHIARYSGTHKAESVSAMGIGLLHCNNVYISFCTH